MKEENLYLNVDIEINSYELINYVNIEPCLKNT